jgi:hypothetical protein
MTNIKSKDDLHHNTTTATVPHNSSKSTAMQFFTAISSLTAACKDILVNVILARNDQHQITNCNNA